MPPPPLPRLLFIATPPLATTLLLWTPTDHPQMAAFSLWAVGPPVLLCLCPPARNSALLCTHTATTIWKPPQHPSTDPASHPVSSLFPERISVAPVRTHTVWGSQGPELGPVDLRWPRRCVSVPCAVTMPLGTTMGCGPVRAARPSLRGASRVTMTICAQQPISALLTGIGGRAARLAVYGSVTKLA